LGLTTSHLGVGLGGNDSRGTLLLTGTNFFPYVTNRGVATVGIYGDQAGGAIGVEDVATELIMSGRITGDSFIKSGAGTLTLTNATNNYTGDTYIEAGTLNVGADGAVIPANSNVTVFSGATFQVGSTYGDNSAAPIGTLTLDGGVFRMPDHDFATKHYYVNRLVTSTAGGGVEVGRDTLYFQGAGRAAVFSKGLKEHAQ
jgi:fibronectin-binding autotransporter adhesin